MGENREGTPGSPPSGRRPMHPQLRLAREIQPCLRELDDHEWTPEERDFLADSERLEGRSLTEPEKRLWVAQARLIGDV